jgi:hypothetical protein
VIAGDPTPITNDSTPQATRPLDQTPQTNDPPYQHRHIRCLPPSPSCHCCSSPTGCPFSTHFIIREFKAATIRLLECYVQDALQLLLMPLPPASAPHSLHQCAPPASACTTCLSMCRLPQRAPCVCTRACISSPPCNW